MAKINIQGVGVSVTETMRTEAQKAISKVFNRYPPISHRLTVRESPKGIELKLSYQEMWTAMKQATHAKTFTVVLKSSVTLCCATSSARINQRLIKSEKAELKTNWRATASMMMSPN